MRQLYLTHTALLVCAYVGFLGYFAVTDPNDPVAALFRERAEVTMPAAAASSPPKVAASSAVEQKVVAPEAVAAAPVMDDSARKKEHARLRALGMQATRGEQPLERAEAIDQLNAATPETLQALQAVVTTDAAARNRIRAINSLRALAEREGAQDAVVSILRLAMTDSNPGVASRAAEAYRELTAEPVE